jgi:hypothetical protein
MTQLYVARRTFKAGGKVYFQGDIIEDITKVHRHRLRIKEEKVLPIPNDKEGLEKLQHFFMSRATIDIKKKIAERATKGSETAEPVKSSASAKPTTPGTSKPQPLTRGVNKAKPAPVTEK